MIEIRQLMPVAFGLVKVSCIHSHFTSWILFLFFCDRLFVSVSEDSPTSKRGLLVSRHFQRDKILKQIATGGPRVNVFINFRNLALSINIERPTLSLIHI